MSIPLVDMDINNPSSSSSAGRSRSRHIHPIEDQVTRAIQANFITFIRGFEVSFSSSSNDLNNDIDGNSISSVYPYMEALRSLRLKQKDTLRVDYVDLHSQQPVLSEKIVSQFYRYEPALCETLSDLMKEICESEGLRELEEAKENALKEGREVNEEGIRKISPLKRYYIAISNLPKTAAIRDLHANQVGQLMAISGTITRSSQVRPELLSASFYCSDCHLSHLNVTQQFKYTTPPRCSNPLCNNQRKWDLDQRNCVFVDWQQLKLQENASDIPAGSMPRTVKVIVRGEACEAAKPGDKVILTGTLIVVPDVTQLTRGTSGPSGNHNTAVRIGREGSARGAAGDGSGVGGLKELGVRELQYSLVFLACHVKPFSSLTVNSTSIPPSRLNDYTAVASVDTALETDDFATLYDSLTLDERSTLERMRHSPKLYTKMIRSLATNIHGHEEIKRGLLLMLLGGVHKETHDGQRLRGDINLCIVGDPSTSKSQFLKYICDFLPRAVYTSGKASSAAGLTASVSKDIETGEWGIEAGALMLADNGICCIDEFDKMEITDQVAIHEAMEQQTISIAKAGIQATLNARTSVLAAANPIRGRYDKTKTLKQNVDISAPIMSRFDLFFVVLDEQRPEVDYSLASHILDVHMGEYGTDHQAPFTMREMQLYVKVARTIKPKLTPASQKRLIKDYVELRAADSTGINKSSYRITVRQLESLIRLSEARARVELSEIVEERHVQEAARLLKKSIVRVEAGELVMEEEEEGEREEESEEEGELNNQTEEERAALEESRRREVEAEAEWTTPQDDLENKQIQENSKKEKEKRKKTARSTEEDTSNET